MCVRACVWYDVHTISPYLEAVRTREKEGKVEMRERIRGKK
jgi:hypothetical protein